MIAKSKKHATMKAIEAFIGTLGIAIVGWITIPLAAAVAGVEIATGQAVVMSAVFFVGRFLWLFGVRVFFSKWGEK